MRIKELLEGPVNTSLKTRELNKNMSAYKNPRRYGVKKPDTGAFSNVVPDADPHMVKKTSNKSFPPGTTEGFRMFIEFINKNGHADNPHMPRVYKANKIVGKDGYSIDTYKLEKLLPYSQVAPHEIQALTESIISPDLIPGWVRHSNEVHDYCLVIVDNIEAEIFKAQNRFNLDSLNEACKIVKQALDELDARLDLHSRNIMFRRTPHGLQIVINDPIYVDALLVRV